MDIKLIAMDLDGTTLMPSTQSFSPRLHDALLKAHNQGIFIVPTSGRQFILLPDNISKNDVWKKYGIFSNGAQIRDIEINQTLAKNHLSTENLSWVTNLANRLEIPVEICIDGHLYLTQKSYDMQQDDDSLKFHRDFVLKRYGHIVNSLEEMLENNIDSEKVNLPLIPEEKYEVLKQELNHSELSLAWLDKSRIEITHLNATKGKGLIQLCDILGIDIKHTMTLGDSGNDISMFQVSGLSVAMENAPDDIKKYADIVTLSNIEDGAAIAIERMLNGTL